VQKDKNVFKLEDLPVQRFAESLGLPGAPKIKFLKKEIAKKKKNLSYIAANTTSQEQTSKTALSEDETGESDEDAEDLSVHSLSDEEEEPSSAVTNSQASDKVRERSI
jgi:ATP-dependent RNA helicase DDX10/DBP4